jgi:ADP-ribose pyrophosphatase YjhB (NUDIX family)
LDKRRIASLLKHAPWIGEAAQKAYRTWQPRVTVGVVGAIFNDRGQLLIVEHVFHPKFPWGLPGGWMARNESPEDTVRREVLEETTLRINVIKPLLITPTPQLRWHLDIAFLCQLMPDAHETDIHLSSELLDYQWSDPLQTPPMGFFHSRVVKAALAERAAAAGGKPLDQLQTR